MSEATSKTQLAVIGAGPGGYPAAFHAADKGMEVVLIDLEENPGGVCLFRGCIPTKTLLHVTEVIRESREAKNWGVEFEEPKVSLNALRNWKDAVIRKMTGGLGQLSKQRHIRYIQGRARFIDSGTVEVEKTEGGKETLAFDDAIVATGSHPAALPNLTLYSPRIMQSAEAMNLPDIPETLLVIGGGYIGLELGTIYSTLGSQVTVVEMMPTLLPGADADLVRTYSMTARKQFSRILTQTTVVDMKEQDGGIRVVWQDKDGKTEENVFSKVLTTIGRKPNSKGLGLENTHVEVDKSGFIRVNSHCRTADTHIYAIGDVVGGAMLAHKATHEGRVAVENIAGNTLSFEPKAIPAVLFTDPEVTWCGMSEEEAKTRGVDVEVAKFPWGASGRASSLGRADGLTKLIIDPSSEAVLGVGIVGPGAGELISEGALAIEMGAKASDLARTIHPHPTLSETLMEAADVFYGHCTHVYRPKR